MDHSVYRHTSDITELTECASFFLTRLNGHVFNRPTVLMQTALLHNFQRTNESTTASAAVKKLKNYFSLSSLMHCI